MSRAPLAGNWRLADRADLRSMNRVNEIFRAIDLRSSTALPNFDGAEALMIGSDYGGQHAESRYESFAFIIADSGRLLPWFQGRAALREDFLPDGRRMSFKSLNDRLRMAVLPDFLDLADQIPGLLLVVLFDKRIDTIFAPEQTEETAPPLRQQLDQWSTRTQEKLLRICHLVALAVAGLTRDSQHLLWVTDQDDIAANVERHTLFVKVFGNIVSHYLQHSLGHVRVATTASDDGSREIEDFVAIADLAAGAVCQVLNADGVGSLSEVAGLVLPNRADMPQKTRWLLNWFSNDAMPLRRVVLAFDTIEDSQRLAIRHIKFVGANELVR